MNSVSLFMLIAVFVGSCFLHRFIVESSGKPTKFTDLLAVFLFVQLGFIGWKVFFA
jgi:hypothetical protein